jgi:hypothetical protein
MPGSPLEQALSHSILCHSQKHIGQVDNLGVGQVADIRGVELAGSRELIGYVNRSI